ncbi:hypothetical protein LINPERPRIM_LOCUS38755 [Linum perenne]
MRHWTRFTMTSSISRGSDPEEESVNWPGFRLLNKTDGNFMVVNFTVFDFWRLKSISLLDCFYNDITYYFFCNSNGL